MARGKHGWTYFIQGINGGPVKIGSTLHSPRRRLMALQCGNPEELRVVALLPSTWLERDLHSHFEEAHIRGEWYHSGPILDWLHDNEWASTHAIRHDDVFRVA